MKKLALAAAITAVAAGAAFAGSMEAPVMEMAPVVEEASSSSAGGMIVPLILLALVALAVANN